MSIYKNSQIGACLFHEKDRLDRPDTKYIPDSSGINTNIVNSPIKYVTPQKNSQKLLKALLKDCENVINVIFPLETDLNSFAFPCLNLVFFKLMAVQC